MKKSRLFWALFLSIPLSCYANPQEAPQEQTTQDLPVSQERERLENFKSIADKALESYPQLLKLVEEFTTHYRDLLSKIKKLGALASVNNKKKDSNAKNGAKDEIFRSANELAKKIREKGQQSMGELSSIYTDFDTLLTAIENQPIPDDEDDGKSLIKDMEYYTSRLKNYAQSALLACELMQEENGDLLTILDEGFAGDTLNKGMQMLLPLSLNGTVRSLAITADAEHLQESVNEYYNYADQLISEKAEASAKADPQKETESEKNHQPSTWRKMLGKIPFVGKFFGQHTEPSMESEKDLSTERDDLAEEEASDRSIEI